jgi:hypothetical protein
MMQFLGDDLVSDRLVDNKINDPDAVVPTIVEKIVNFVIASTGVQIDAEEIATLKANMTKAFSDSKRTKDNTWEYRIFFAFPNPDLPTDFYSVVTTVKLVKNVTEESSWLGLRKTVSESLSASVTTMQLIVTKDFKYPFPAH